MLTKYNSSIENNIILLNLKRLLNQIYKLLPYKEEQLDWEKPLLTIQQELAGMNGLFVNYDEFNTTLLSVQCKLESLLSPDITFEEFRRTIFDCIGRVKDLQDYVRF